MKYFYYRIFPLFFVLFILSSGVNGQELKFLKNISFEYGVQVPFADMKERFGTNFQLGTHFEMISVKKNWLVGLSGHFMFGRNVKQDVLRNLRTDEGQIIGNDRQFANVFLRQRGFQFQVYGGKVFSLFDKHPISGIKITLGTGLLQHQIRVQDDTRTVTELTGEYLKGYDRLTNGLAVTSFIGYQHMDRRGRINLLAGFDLTTAFTKNRRDFDFAILEKLEDNRKDILAGFKIGFMVHIGSSKASGENIIY